MAEVAQNLGKPLLPHQREIVDVAFEIDPETGYLAYDELNIIAPRQVSGKTELLLPIMTYRCLGFGPELIAWVRQNLGHEVIEQREQRVVYTAQAADKARLKWRDIHKARLERSKYRKDFTARLQQNQEMFTFRNGSTWSPVAPTGAASGTGDTLDCPVIDEAWAQKDFRTELGLRPAMITRFWRQLVIASMIPGLSRAEPGSWGYLARKRELGRARVQADTRHGVAFFDYAAPEDADPGDPATWWACMPGLGYTAPERTIKSDYDSMDLTDFCAEYLGWAPIGNRPRWSLISSEIWKGLRDDTSQIVGPVCLAAEITEDRSQGWVLAAGLREDGHRHIEVLEPSQVGKIPIGTLGVDWMERRIIDIAEKNDVLAVALGADQPANSLKVPLENAGIDVLTPTVQAMAGACGRFFDYTGQEPGPEDLGIRLRYIWNPDLDRALAGAYKFDLGGGTFVFARRGTPNAIRPLNAAVLALHAVEVKGPLMAPEPEIFV